MTPHRVMSQWGVQDRLCPAARYRRIGLEPALAALDARCAAARQSLCQARVSRNAPAIPPAAQMLINPWRASRRAIS